MTQLLSAQLQAHVTSSAATHSRPAPVVRPPVSLLTQTPEQHAPPDTPHGPSNTVSQQPCNDSIRVTRRIKAARTWEQAFGVFVQSSHVFNSINTSALVFRMAQLVEEQRHSGELLSYTDQQDLRAALREVHDFAEAELPRMRSRELSTTAHGLAKLGVLDRRFVQLLVARTQPVDMNNMELSGILWALAHSGHRPSDVKWMRAVTAQVVARRSTLRNKELATCLWAWAKLGYCPGQSVLDSLVQEAGSRSSKLLPVDFANIIWALALFHYHPASQAPAQPAAQSPCDSDSVSAPPDVAAAGHGALCAGAPTALDRVLEAAAASALDCSPRNASLILWSVAVGGWRISEGWVERVLEGLGQVEWQHKQERLKDRQQVRERVAAAQTPASRDGITRGAFQHSGEQPVGTETGDATGAVPGGQLSTAQGTAPGAMQPQPPGSRLSDHIQVGQWRWQWRQRWRAHCGISSHDAAMALQGLAVLKHDPGSEVLTELAHQVFSNLSDSAHATNTEGQPPHAQSYLPDWEWDGPVCADDTPSPVPQDMASCLWALAHLGHTLPSDHLNTVWHTPLAAFQPQQVASVVTSVARLGVAHPPWWLKRVCHHMLKWHDFWGPREVSHVMWALARMHTRLSGRTVSLLLHAVLHPPCEVLHSPPHAADPSHSYEDSHSTGAANASTAQPMHPAALACQPAEPQHVANAIYALPWLLPPNRLSAFGHVSKDLLQSVEALMLQQLQDSGGQQDRTRAVAHPAHRTDTWGTSELLQVAQGFAAVHHTPSSQWLQVHQAQIAKLWRSLSASQQDRLLLCYLTMTRGGGKDSIMWLLQGMDDPGVRRDVVQRAHKLWQEAQHRQGQRRAQRQQGRAAAGAAQSHSQIAQRL